MMVLCLVFVVIFLSAVSEPQGLNPVRVEYHESSKSGLKFQYYFLNSDDYKRAMLTSNLKWRGDNVPCDIVGSGCSLGADGEYIVYFPAEGQ